MSIFNIGTGGGTPTLEARTVTPSTSQQIIKPSRDEYDGLSQVTVEATPLETKTVNPSISSQTITPSGSNIGFSTITINPYRLQSKNVTPSTSAQTVSPDSGYNGLSRVSVGAVSLQSKTVSPSSLPSTITQDSGYTGLSSVTIQKPSSLISDNIAVGNSIFGVTGTAKTVYKVYLKGWVTNAGTTVTLTLYGDSGYVSSPTWPSLNKFALISFDCNGSGTQSPPIIRRMGLVGDVNIEFSYPNSSNSLSFIGVLSESQYTEFYGSVSSTININISTNIIVINKTPDQYQFVSGTWEGYALLAFIS